jgi:hypothetical protein
MRTDSCKGCTVVMVIDVHSLRREVRLSERSETPKIQARGLHG